MHVFISYKSEDYEQRDKLVKYLEEYDINYWVDLEIEAGLGWRDEIDNALLEAYAVLVIVTSNTIKSHYITYEWSWAQGSGIHVLPLIFENTSGLHAKLNSLEYIDCTANIPNSLKDTLNNWSDVDRLSRYTNSKIVRKMSSPLILLAFVNLFIPYYRSGLLSENDINAMLQVTSKHIIKLNNLTLPDLWVEVAHILSPVQKKRFRAICESIQIAVNIFSKSSFRGHGLSEKLLRKYATEPFFKGDEEHVVHEISQLWEESLKELFCFFMDNTHQSLHGFFSDRLSKASLSGIIPKDNVEYSSALDMFFLILDFNNDINEIEVEIFAKIKKHITGIDVQYG